MFLSALSHNQTKHKSLLTWIVRVLEEKTQTKYMPKLESTGLVIKFSSNNRVIWKVTLSSPCLSPPYPLFQWYPQSNEILLNLSMKCWNSTFNAQGSRVIIVVVEVGTHKRFSMSDNDPTEGLALKAKRFKNTVKTIKN
jgi:hypothetical protein